MEYKGYYALFYLKRRSNPQRWRATPVDREYRWWVSYLNTTRADLLKRVYEWRPYSDAFYRKVVNDPEAIVVLPAHAPELYVDFATSLGGSVEYFTRRVTTPAGEKLRVRVPVIAFPGEVSAYKHVLYAATLAATKNPTLYAGRLAEAIAKRPTWSDMFGLACCDRFLEVRGPGYSSNGYWWVVRIGRAFRVIAGLD